MRERTPALRRGSRPRRGCDAREGTGGRLWRMAKRKKRRVDEKVAARQAARRAAPAHPPPSRPFQGLPPEVDWVAMREIVPAASAWARTTEEYGSQDVQVVTLLPMLWPAMKREDGVVVVALQFVTNSGDPSRDAAAAL